MVICIWLLGVLELAKILCSGTWTIRGLYLDVKKHVIVSQSNARTVGPERVGTYYY